MWVYGAGRKTFILSFRVFVKGLKIEYRIKSFEYSLLFLSADSTKNKSNYTQLLYSRNEYYFVGLK